MHYYCHHIGDYRKDTTHLSFLEHGIYRHLLDSYYLNEIPLHGDLDKLMRAHSIRNADEKQALCNVLADFFLLTKKGYIHARCDAEIEAFHAKSEQARKAAIARWANRHNGSDAAAMQPHISSNAGGMPTNIQEPITNNQIKTIAPNGFDLFWKSYPKKSKKGGALKIWQRLKIDQALQDKILKSVEAYKTSEKVVKGYVMEPTTWLNNGCWDDEVKTSAFSTNDIFTPARRTA